MERFPTSFPLDWNHPLLFLFIKTVYQPLTAEYLGPSGPRELKRNLENLLKLLEL